MFVFIRSVSATPFINAAWRAAEAAEAQRRAEICARADQQHQWAMEGEPRGLFGDYPSATDSTA